MLCFSYRAKQQTILDYCYLNKGATEIINELIWKKFQSELIFKNDFGLYGQISE